MASIRGISQKKTAKKPRHAITFANQKCKVAFCVTFSPLPNIISTCHGFPLFSASNFAQEVITAATERSLVIALFGISRFVRCLITMVASPTSDTKFVK